MNQHYFGSTAFSWAVADTREEVLAKLARTVGADIIKRNVKANGGMYAWTCLVPMPQDVHYDISNFAPEIPYNNVQEFNMQNVKGHSLPITRLPKE